MKGYMEKFEYENERFSKEPRLYIDKSKREISISSPNEYYVLTLSKDISGGQFTILFNVLSDLMPNIAIVIATMYDMASKLEGACVLSELKQGVIWDRCKAGQFKEDRWGDGMPFSEWCSSEQVAKEYYRRPNRAKKTFEEKKINLQDLLNIANLKIEENKR